MRVIASITFMIVGSFPGWGEEATFDVASVKPADPARRGTTMADDPATLTIRNGSLLYCMMFSYELKDYQIVGPDWISTEIYDVIAKTMDPPVADLHRSMLQGLLVDRFKLTFHRETREVPIYALVVGSRGPRLQPVEPLAGQNPQRGFVLQGEMSMSKLADAISGPWIRRPVLDRTGLAGEFELRFDPMAYLGTESDPDAKPDMELATQRALKELGLELKPSKAPFEVLVIDHVEKLPTAN